MAVTTDDRPQGGIRRRRRLARWIGIVSALILVPVLAVGGFYTTRTVTTLERLPRSDALVPVEVADRPPASATAEGAMTIALLGSDSRDPGDRGRSDVLMLAHLSPKRDKVYLISFPRDLWVPVPGHGKAKINAAYAWGGPQLTVRTVEQLIGVRVDHVAQVDFEGFVGLTDQVGGVTITNPHASSSRGFSWPKGQVTLSGASALAYVRQRYELPNGDLDRAARQRAVTKALLQKLLSTDVLTNPARFSTVLDELGRYLTVDSGLTTQQILTTASSMRLASGDDIRSLQTPVRGLGTSKDGQSIVLANDTVMAELSAALRGGTMDAYWAAHRNDKLLPRG